MKSDFLVAAYVILLVIVITVVTIWLFSSAGQCQASGGNFVKDWTGWYVCIRGRE